MPRELSSEDFEAMRAKIGAVAAALYAGGGVGAITMRDIAKKLGRSPMGLYRYFADRVACELGICGYVKNLWDGNVEVYAIGDAVALEELKRQLAEGPRSARITAIDESDEPVDKRYNRFVIEG